MVELLTAKIMALVVAALAGMLVLGVVAEKINWLAITLLLVVVLVAEVLGQLHRLVEVEVEELDF